MNFKSMPVVITAIAITSIFAAPVHAESASPKPTPAMKHDVMKKDKVAMKKEAMMKKEKAAMMKKEKAAMKHDKMKASPSATAAK